MLSATTLDSVENVVLSPLRDHEASACSWTTLHWPATTGACARQVAEGEGRPSAGRGREDRTAQRQHGRLLQPGEATLRRLPGQEGGAGPGSSPAMSGPGHSGRPRMVAALWSGYILGKWTQNYLENNGNHVSHYRRSQDQRWEKTKARMNPPVSY